MKIKLNELDMELYKEKLDNGLTVMVIPKEGIQKTVDWMKWYYRIED